MFHTSLAGSLVAAPVAAQVAPGGTAAPTMDMAANGTPVVRIKSPNQSGVSYNTYNDFNVDARGLILNNSAQIVTTNLGGYIDGNGNLKNSGAARVILNEVAGQNPSRLLGYIEVAGPAAQVVLANANGIECDGCGFINTPWATLTTGKAMFGPDAGLTGYAVDRGAVTVNGRGLNASGARLDLFARALQLNAGIWAESVNGTFGAGDVGTDVQEIIVSARTAGLNDQPRFGLDVAALGGMYAGAIRLIGTEAGLGVNVDGQLASLERGLTLTTAGRIEVGGAVTAKTDAALQGGDLDITGQVYADGDVSATGASLAGSGLLAGGGNVAITARHIDTSATVVAGLARDGTISQTGDLSLASEGLLSLGGQTLAHDRIALSGDAIDISDRVQASHLTASANRIEVAGDMRSAGALDLNARDSLINRGIVSGSNVTIDAGGLDNSDGIVSADVGLDVRGGAIVNTGGVFQSAGAMTFVGQSLTNSDGAILALGKKALRLDIARAITGTGGRIGGNGDVRVLALSLRLDGAGASLAAAGALNVAVAGNIHVSDGAVVTGGGDINLSAGRDVALLDGAIQASTTLALGAANLWIGAHGSLAGGRIEGTVAQNLVNAGTILSGQGQGTAALSAGGDFTNSGSIYSNSINLAIRAGALTNTGDISHAGAGWASTMIDGALISSGRIATNGALAVSAASLDNSGTLYSGEGQSLRVSGTFSTNGLISSGGSLLVNAASILAQGGSLQSQADFTLNGDTIDLGAAELLALGSGPLAISSRGTLTGGSVRIGGNGDVSLTAASISLGQSEMTALGALDLRATNGDVSLGADSSFVSAGDLSVISAGLLQATGSEFLSQGTALLAARELALDDGLIEADSIKLDSPALSLRRSSLRQTGSGDFVLTTSDTLDYSGGEIYAAGQNFTVSAGAIVNQNGALLHGGAGLMSVTSAGAIENSAGQIATNGALRLTATRFDNATGEVTSASAATIDIAGDLQNDGGFIASGDGLVLSAGAVSNSGGAIETTGRLDARLGSLNSGAGSLLATGTGATLTLDVTGAVSAPGGLVGSTGNVTITAGSFSLDGEARLTAGEALVARARTGDLLLGGGTVDGASVNLAADNGTLGTGAGGLILTPGQLSLSGKVVDLSAGAAQGGSVSLQAGHLLNQRGSLQALGTLAANVSGIFDNSGGEVFAGESLTLSSGSLVNRSGRVAHGGTGILSLQVAGQLDNSAAGLIATNGTLDMRAAGLRNDGGQITASLGATIAVSGTLSNLAGAIQSDARLALTAGSLANDAGAIDSLAGLTVRATAIDNASGSIIAHGGTGLSIAGLSGQAATLANGVGTIGSQGALALNASAITNQGSILGGASALDFGSLVNSGTIYGSDLRLVGAHLVNTGGEIGSGGAVDLIVADLDNRAGQIVSGAEGLTYLGTTLLNDRGTLGGDGVVKLVGVTIDNGQGTIAAGRDLTVASTTLSNAANGTVWADNDASLTTSGSLTNGGSLAAARELVVDAALLDNASGTLAAGAHLSLGYSNATLGHWVTGSDLTLRPTGDFIVGVGTEFSVTGLLALDVGGSLTNHGNLGGKTGVLVRTGGNLANEAAGQIIGDVLLLDVAGELLNRGLINGGAVELSARSLINFAKIYGDTVRATGSQSLVNQGSAAIIATRSGLLALQSAGSIENHDGAWFYSLGDLYIGGSNGSGSAGSLVNSSATIQVRGNSSIAAGNISNLRSQFEWEDVVTHTFVPDHIVDYPPRSDYEKTELEYDETRTDTRITADSGEARIIIDGNLAIATGSLTNQYSTISAGGSLFVNGLAAGQPNDAVTNTSLVGRFSIDREGRYRSTKDGAVGNVHKSDPYSFHDEGDTFTVPAIFSAGGSLRIDAQNINNVVLRAQGGSAVEYAAGTDEVTRGNIGSATGGAPVEGVSGGSVGPGVTGSQFARVDGVGGGFVAPLVSGVPLDPAQGRAFGLSLAPVLGQSLGNGAYPVLNLGPLHRYADPSAHYLVETDPAFTNYKNFVSSDYFLDRLGYDPARVQRRMGDALYEHQLISNQLVAGAGVSLLAGYANAEAQYRSLMDAGAAYMQAFNLALGVGLTAEQMATLTSDIVLLVEVTVQTPTGPQTVLTPRVYLSQVSARDMTTGGAIMAGSDVSLRAANTLTNAGVVRASAGAVLLGNDILNTGRLDLGAQGLVSAANDLTNRGGTITGGDLTLAAGRDLTLDAAATTTRTATAWNVRGNRGSETTETTLHKGSLVEASGDVTLIAGRDLTVRGSTVDATGALAAQAQTITVTGVIDSASVVSDTVRKSGGFLSSTKTTTHYEGTDQSVVSSTLSGDTVSLRSAGDTTILGSNVVGTGDVTVNASGALTVGAMAEQDHEAQSSKVKKSGISVGGGGLFAGVASNRNESTLDSVTHTGSLVGSATGNTTLVAEGALTVSGSQVVSPGTTTLAGQSVTIEHVTDTLDTTSSSKSSSFGLSLGVQSPLVNGVETAARMGEVASGTGNDRVAAVAGLAGGLAAYNAADAVMNDPGSLGGVNVSASVGFSKSRSSGESHDETVIGSTVSGGNVNLVASGAGANSTIRIAGSDVLAENNLLLAAEGAITAEAAAERDTFSGSSKSVGAGVGVSMGLGATAQPGPTLSASFSGSKGSYSGEEVSNRERLLVAGGTATVSTPGTFTLDGAQLAGSRVEVEVGNLEIVSRQDTASYDASNKSIGAGVSFTPSTGMVSGNVNLGSGKQQGDFASVAEQAGIYAGAGGYDIDVAGKTSLTGAVIASEAEAANNRLSTGTLEIAEIENRESWSASQTNFGVGLGGNVGKTSGGDTAVGTDRVPGPPLAGVNVPGLGTVSATPPVAMGASGQQSSTTGSAIAPGTIEITSGDAASLAAAGTVSRDTGSANTPLVREFDDTLRQEIADGFDAARTLVNETDTFLTNRANEADAKKKEADAARLAGDLETANRLDAEARDIEATWGMGGEGRQILTALSAAAGGNVTGSAGQFLQAAAANWLQQNAAEWVGDQLASGAIREGSPEHLALHALIGCAGSAAGGGNCTSGAAGASGATLLEQLFSLNGSGPNGEVTNTDKEARSALVQALVAGLGSAAGVDGGALADVLNSARAEVENNGCVAGACAGYAPDGMPWDEFKTTSTYATMLAALGDEAEVIACVNTPGSCDAKVQAYVEQHGEEPAPGAPAEQTGGAGSVQRTEEQLASDRATSLGEMAGSDTSASKALAGLPQDQRDELADAYARLPEGEKAAYQDAARAYAQEAASPELSEAELRLALQLFGGVPSASVLNMTGAELAANYAPQLRQVATRTGRSPAAILGLLVGAGIGAELLGPDYNNLVGTDLTPGNPWGSNGSGGPDPGPKIPLIPPPLDEQVGIRDGQAVYKDGHTGEEYTVDHEGHRAPASLGDEVQNEAVISGKTCVYSCVIDGTIRYVGITDDVMRRGAEHLRKKGIVIETIRGLTDLSRTDARAVEQTLIHYYGLGKDGGKLLNEINSISPTRNSTTYEKALIRGKELLDSVDYQWER
ncbi:MAG: hemagglutinin repeat-containing protein [Porphyrobacter sp.]|nr:hemagglutinin repeat-containing protein [Porphyrobacter sp.]